MKKYCFITLGIISLCLGTLGIFLPVLPTTPFLLLSAFLFGKSSKKCYDFIVNNKVFGKYINDYMTHKGITKKNKIIAICFLALTLSFSAYKMHNLYGRIFLLIVFLGVTIHLLKLKTIDAGK
jgi:uncharacterized membrane protein YbaN (DUF454 family)